MPDEVIDTHNIFFRMRNRPKAADGFSMLREEGMPKVSVEKEKDGGGCR